MTTIEEYERCVERSCPVPASDLRERLIFAFLGMVQAWLEMYSAFGQEPREQVLDKLGDLLRYFTLCYKLFGFSFEHVQANPDLDAEPMALLARSNAMLIQTLFHQASLQNDAFLADLGRMRSILELALQHIGSSFDEIRAQNAAKVQAQDGYRPS